MRAGSNPTDPQRISVGSNWPDFAVNVTNIVILFACSRFRTMQNCEMYSELRTSCEWLPGPTQPWVRQETAAGTDCPAFGARKGCNFASTWALQVKLLLWTSPHEASISKRSARKRDGDLFCAGSWKEFDDAKGRCIVMLTSFCGIQRNKMRLCTVQQKVWTTE